MDLNTVDSYMSGIFEKITSAENLFAAWRGFRRGKRDKPGVPEFERCIEDNIFELADALRSGRYRHGSYKRFLVRDPKLRVIHKATVRDRLVHHAVHRILYPVLDRSFIFDSYSCRIGKGTHAAVCRFEVFARKVSRNYRGPCWVLKFDIKRFFDSVDHAILLDCLKRRIDCSDTICLLEEIVGSFALQNTPPKHGLPLGNLTSQLFANVYLDAFDHFVKERLGIRHYIRYTDDAVILHHDPAFLEMLLGPIAVWLWEERRLALHPRKVEIRKLTQGIDFLGYVSLPKHRVLRTKTKKRMMRRIDRKNTSSYLGVLKHCEGYTLRKAIIRQVSKQKKARG